MAIIMGLGLLLYILFGVWLQPILKLTWTAKLRCLCKHHAFVLCCLVPLAGKSQNEWGSPRDVDAVAGLVGLRV